MVKNYLKWLWKVIRKPNEHQALKKYLLFRELNPFELSLVNACLHNREYRAGEVLFEEGHPLEVLFFIVSGEMQVTGKLNPQGSAVLKKHQFIGVIDLFGNNKRSGSATALTDLSVLALTESDFQDLISKNKRLGNKLLKACGKFLASYLQDMGSGY
jgi:CRP-like cAMP-binding protein